MHVTSMQLLNAMMAVSETFSVLEGALCSVWAFLLHVISAFVLF